MCDRPAPFTELIIDGLVVAIIIGYIRCLP